MKKLLNLLMAMVVVTFICPSCKTTQVSSVASYASFETECLGVELDGSQTLRAWGKGKDRADALEQAKKNAVRDVIFKGIRSGECNTKPLIFEVNAEEKYQYYFNKFFADGGEYKKYVSDADENLTSRMKAVSNTQQNWGVVVLVLRDDLRERLIQDNIIKP